MRLLQLVRPWTVLRYEYAMQAFAQPLLDWRAHFNNWDSLPDGATSQEKAQRGRSFERILHGMFAEAHLDPRLSFRPKGEELDGSFWFEGRTILIEAKWTKDAHPASSLYQFRGKVDGKLVGTLGLFISMAGFTPDAVDALVAGKELNVVLADGADIRSIVNGEYSIRDAIRHKLRAGGDVGTPFFPLADAANVPLPSSHARSEIMLVEGRSDAFALESVGRVYASAGMPRIVPAGGPVNMVPLLRALSSTSDRVSFTLVIDADSERLVPSFEKAGNELGLEIEVLSFSPDLETALGLSGSTHYDWRRLSLKKNDFELLDRLIASSELLHRASTDEQLSKLIRRLGITSG